MADSRRHRRRAARASSSSQPCPATIDGWISDQGKHADYVNSWQERRIMATNRRKLLVGGFKVEERMIRYLIVWILCPRATNHAQCSEQDLLLLILEYKGVNVEGELVQAIQAVGSKIGDTTFRQMGFITRGRVLIHKDDDHPDEDEDDDIDTHMAEPVSAAAPFDAGPSTMPSSSSLFMEEHFARLSKQLEDMSLAQRTPFEEIYEWQQSIDEYMVGQFLDLDVRLSHIENHLNLQPLERALSPEF
ncbi:hypothetical protein LR48_Vigan04g157700 [Vigna angularis]|uniref:Uncharacterized protein n=1 Tax=Phaseolus angularis TaxID=3914 RepID=A0A0L9UFQ3_PHAAN|nr:hypothetical protein LR48_Vigan04g157700 [Vigna angularis]